MVHELLEKLFGAVKSERSEEALLKYEAAFGAHAGIEEETAAGTSSEHAASHTHLASLLRAEASRLATAGEGARVGPSFVETFEAAMELHEEEFDRAPLEKEAKPTPATQRIWMDLKAEEAGDHSALVPKWFTAGCVLLLTLFAASTA